jgi:hypothetical protein
MVPDSGIGQEDTTGLEDPFRFLHLTADHKRARRQQGNAGITAERELEALSASGQ